MNTTKSETLANVPAKSHLGEAGESYFEHMGHAFSFSRRMIGAGVGCFLHGIFPNYFCKTGSSCIEVLHDEMVIKRANLKALKN